MDPDDGLPVRQGSDPASVPELVRKAFKVAESEKPGSTHIELPEDVMAAPLSAAPLPRRGPMPAEPPPQELVAAAAIICGADYPVILAGNGVVRGRSTQALREFARTTGIWRVCHELETAMRLRTAFVTVVWEDGQFGSIVWKQEKKFGRHFGTDFGNPDFVRLAESFGMPAWRVSSADEFGERLRLGLGLDVPSPIVLPIDYSVDIATQV